MYYPNNFNSAQNSVLSCVKTEATASGNEIIALADVKTFARITSASEDSLFTSLISAARQWIEEYLNKSLVANTIVSTIYQDATFPQMLGYGNVGIISKVEFRYYPLTPWLDITDQKDIQWEIQTNDFYANMPGYYRITYTTTPSLSGLAQLQTANKQLVIFLYENRGDQQLFQVGGQKDAVRVVPDIIKNTLSGLKENTSWFG